MTTTQQGRPEQPAPDYVPGHDLLAGKVVAVTAGAGAGRLDEGQPSTEPSTAFFHVIVLSSL